MQSPYCVCICLSVYTSINSSMSEPSFRELDMNILAHKSYPSARKSLCVCPHRCQATARHIRLPCKESQNKGELLERSFSVQSLLVVGIFVFQLIVVRLWLVKHIPEQRRIFGCFVFYALRVLLKVSRRLTLPGTSC